MKAYHINPIDFNWEYLPTIEESATKIASAEACYRIKGFCREGLGGAGVEINDFFRNLEKAKALAKEVGWEGDYREEPRVFWMPDDGQFSYGFAWKQDNNGSTFVISPFDLPWLESLCC